MQPNSTYDLMIQLVEESKSLWRIRNDYPTNAAGDAELVAFWEKLAAEKEARVAELTALVKARLD